MSLRSSLLPSTSVTVGTEQAVRLRADLVGGAIVDAQGARAAADVHAERLPRERLLEDALAEVAGEEQSVGPPAAQRGEEPKVGDADVLRLVHDREVEHHLLGLRDRRRERGEQLRVGDQPARLQPGTNALEDGPQHLALRFREPRLSAEARDIAIRLPVLQLPGIDDLLPFREQEMLAELVTANRARGLAHQFAYNLAARQSSPARHAPCRAEDRWR